MSFFFELIDTAKAYAELCCLVSKLGWGERIRNQCGRTYNLCRRCIYAYPVGAVWNHGENILQKDMAFLLN
jgi:hypothetical protein